MTPDVQEVSRVVLHGKDAVKGDPTTVVAMRFSDGTWGLHVPTESHTVRLPADAVAALAQALDPAGPAAVVLALQDNAGRVTFLHAPVSHGTQTVLPTAIVTALQTALAALRKAQRLLGPR